MCSTVQQFPRPSSTVNKLEIANPSESSVGLVVFGTDRTKSISFFANKPPGPSLTQYLCTLKYWFGRSRNVHAATLCNRPLEAYHSGSVYHQSLLPLLKAPFFPCHQKGNAPDVVFVRHHCAFEVVALVSPSIWVQFQTCLTYPSSNPVRVQVLERRIV